MTEKEIIKYIDDGANFYISALGDAEHMEIVERAFYRYVRPKTDEHGIRFIFDVRLDGLPMDQMRKIVSEIKALHMPVWLSLSASDELFYLFFGKSKIHGQTVFEEEDEVYMALLPTRETNDQACGHSIIKVKSPTEFAVWAEITNCIFADGRPDVHPSFHYPLCHNGIMKCYILYNADTPAAVCAVLNNHGIASIEFVATIPEMRRNGYAKAVCVKAIHDAFSDGAKIITVRAANAAASKLYQSLGFKAYNYAL